MPRIAGPSSVIARSERAGKVFSSSEKIAYRQLKTADRQKIGFSDHQQFLSDRQQFFTARHPHNNLASLRFALHHTMTQDGNNFHRNVLRCFLLFQDSLCMAGPSCASALVTSAFGHEMMRVLTLLSPDFGHAMKIHHYERYGRVMTRNRS